MAFVLAQIRTEDLSNMSVDRYCEANLLESIILELSEHRKNNVPEISNEAAIKQV
jgi:hypothetical protein